MIVKHDFVNDGAKISLAKWHHSIDSHLLLSIERTIPALSTLRVLISITTSTKERIRPVNVTASTVKRFISTMAPVVAHS